MDTLTLIQSLIVDLDSLSVKGIENATTIVGMFQKLRQLKSTEQARVEAKQKAAEAELEQKREARRKQLAEAAERGETIVGGETIQINADGTQEVIIP